MPNLFEKTIPMQTNELFETHGKSYELQRYPFKKNSELRAWDSADHYLLNTLSELEIDLNGICIINDNFGALTLPLLEHKPLCYSDSWLSREAIYNNIEANDANKYLDFINLIDELATRPPLASIIIGRVPKSKHQLAFLLQQLHEWAKDGTRLLLAGMDKHLSKGQYDLLEEYFGPSKFYPGVKKARIWEAVLDKNLYVKPVKLKTIELNDFDLSLISHANVFSQDRLDIGTRFFLENFSKLPKFANVADLACGNGILGFSYLRLHPESTMTLSDESFQAKQSCEINWQHNLPEALVTIRADDGLKQAKPSEFNLVLCNPPFHHQHIVGTDIAFSLFKDAFRALRKGGELWIVANRHLAYHIHLNKLFGNCSTEASNKKFVILRAIKFR